MYNDNNWHTLYNFQIFYEILLKSDDTGRVIGDHGNTSNFSNELLGKGISLPKYNSFIDASII